MLKVSPWIFSCGRGEHQLIGVDHVLDVQVRPHLVAAEDRDRALVDRVVGEDVDREIEPRARAVAADGGGTHDDAGEVVGLVLPQDRLAHALELVVERERHQRVIFGDVGRIGHAIDRARRAVDEALHAGLLRGDHDRLEAVVVDGLGQLLVELEARIVGDAGKMQHGVLAFERLGNLCACRGCRP